MSILRMVVSVGIALGVSITVHYWMWARLVRDAHWAAPWNTAFTLAFAVLAVGMPAGMLATFALPRGAAAGLAWPTYLWMGWVFILMVLLIPVELTRLSQWIWAKVTSDVPSPERRLLLARVMSAGVGVVGAGTAAFGVGRAVGQVPVKPIRIPVARLPPSMAGLRIVQLTDIHVGPTIGKRFVEQLVAQTNALEPDVIAITGDLVDGTVEHLGELVRPLSGLRARHGVFFVTGNHEYYSGVDGWLAFLPTLGIRVLHNERVRLETAGGPLEIAGVTDYTAGEFGERHAPDLAKAVAGRDPAVPLVLLAHQPRAADEAASLGVDLQLSGHTHAGQIWPFGLAVRLTTPYVRGLHRVGAMQLYVSCGTGYWGPPMRVGTEAEITSVELTTV